MKGPILVDTSVWINFFRGTGHPEVKLLTEYLEQDGPVYLCPTIVQEILQGIVDDKQFEVVKEYLLTFDILLDHPLEMAIGAAELYRSTRKQGITIRKSNDCLIAYYAVKHGLKVVVMGYELV